jgi:hypothetical protein
VLIEEVQDKYPKNNYLKTITPHRRYGLVDQIGDMNPWGQGYTQFDIFFMLVEKEKGASESISK